MPLNPEGTGNTPSSRQTGALSQPSCPREGEELGERAVPTARETSKTDFP